MEKRIKVRKNEVVKDVEESLICEYLQLGWKKVEEKTNQKNKKNLVVDEEE